MSLNIHVCPSIKSMQGHVRICPSIFLHVPAYSYMSLHTLACPSIFFHVPAYSYMSLNILACPCMPLKSPKRLNANCLSVREWVRLLNVKLALQLKKVVDAPWIFPFRKQEPVLVASLVDYQKTEKRSMKNFKLQDLEELCRIEDWSFKGSEERSKNILEQRVNNLENKIRNILERVAPMKIKNLDYRGKPMMSWKPELSGI